MNEAARSNANGPLLPRGNRRHGSWKSIAARKRRGIPSKMGGSSEMQVIRYKGGERAKKGGRGSDKEGSEKEEARAPTPQS